MPIVNADISEQLNKVADLLDIEGANPFRIRAYRKAARVISELPRSIVQMLDAGEDLDALPGIGKDLAGKITILARTGHLPLLDELGCRLPPGLSRLLDIPGLGPKRVHALHEALGIDTVAQLAAAARAGKIRNLPGFGPVTERRVLQAAALEAGRQRRMKRPAAEQVAEMLLAWLRETPGVKAASIAGSYRRKRETVGDLDMVVAADSGSPVMQRFISYEDVAEVIARGSTRSTVTLRNGLQVDLRVVPQISYGAALLYFTGSKAHNIGLRQIAIDKGLKLNEYGLFKATGRSAGRTEQEIYGLLGLSYVEPELREDQGEIDAARHGRLPKLVTLDQIRGDLHAHTRATDGQFSIAEMARAAQAKGYEYLAITDHSKHLAITHGLDARRLGHQIDEIDRLNAGSTGFIILKSAEVDILEDGSLDLPDSMLKELDLVVGAIHSGFGLSEDEQTERVIRAMDNRCFTILAHPTGRLIDERPAYALNMQRVMKAAIERGCCLEVNAQPDRLDLTDAHCRLAKELGVRLAISTDAHSTHELDFMRFGVDQARRGWIEADDVLNTRSWSELKPLLRHG